MAIDPGNTFDTARNGGLFNNTGRVISDSVSRTDKFDFIRVRFSGRSNFTALLRGLKDNADIALFNSDRKRIAISAKPGTQAESISAQVEAGTYFIRVSRRTGETNYRLRLSSRLAPDPATAKFVGLAGDNSLVFFNSNNLNNTTNIRVSGLQSGENLLGIDFRPNTGQLFGVGSSNRLYAIDFSNGAATQVGTGTFAVPLTGSSYGVDFNPTVDRIRVVSDGSLNLRLNPDTGGVVDGNTTLDGVQPDGSISGATATVSATAYTNSFAGATATTQYTIDSNSDQLFIQAPPNVGTQTLVGGLGVDFAANIGFDIVTDASQANTAFATSNSLLYSINLTTGAATSLGTVRRNSNPVNLVGLAARP
ncbi:MAG: DUF4394 domain-containing protein [Leptolyngbyaceae cyanobacterium SL_7_1]|nr:DUF4394 domain-containing protein [Leptolyngbyaceae cyanobacterium SL_7_1]